MSSITKSELLEDESSEALRVSEARLVVATEAVRRSEQRATSGQLALELMHEIRNPLEAISNLVYLALAEPDILTNVRRYLILADEQISLLREISQQTLGFAQSSAAPRMADLVPLTEAAIRIHQRSIDEKKIHLIKDLPEGIVAEIHSGEILQVVSNLIVNAVDALPLHGTLYLRLRKRPDEVELIIADNGPGIPKELSEEIFQPFFTTKLDHGNGLGLPLSKRIIDRHHGKIRVRSSVLPGRSGTAFKVSLPYASA